MQGHPSQVRMRMQIQQLEAQVRQSEGRTQRAAADGAQLQLLREADFSRFDALRAQQREEAAADAQRQAKLLAQARTELRRPPHECPRPRFTHTAATHMCSVSPTPTPHRSRGPPKLRAPCGRCAPSATRSSCSSAGRCSLCRVWRKVRRRCVHIPRTHDRNAHTSTCTAHTNAHAHVPVWRMRPRLATPLPTANANSRDSGGELAGVVPRGSGASEEGLLEAAQPDRRDGARARHSSR